MSSKLWGSKDLSKENYIYQLVYLLIPGLGHRPAATLLRGLQVRIPLKARMFLSCVFSTGSGLCDELITHVEETYRVSATVCDLETSTTRMFDCIYIYIYCNLNSRQKQRLYNMKHDTTVKSETSFQKKQVCIF